MDKSHSRVIRKFNPGTLQPDEEIISQFVVRTHQLGTVLETLRDNVHSPSCQHTLLVAPRGRGKSMLLARVAAELRTNDTLSESLLPVRFMEESQEIFNIADFWLETLFYLSREIEAAAPGLSVELQKTHADLAGRWSERATGEHACMAALSAADRLGKKLVLMIENLQALCADVDADFDWQLRKVLQSEPRIMLLATATSRFEGLDDAAQPFFELFRIIDLKPLNTDECLRLWHMISGNRVSEREIRPLEILTGGSPRLLVIIGEFARHQSLRQLMEGLVKLIDDHTEYFRGHLDNFAKTERRVFLAVIDLWQPSTTAEIAARARMDIRTVSALLGRLVEQGVLIVDKSQRKRRYVTAERLYSIYYKLRRQRDEAAVVHHLINFMAVFYHGNELTELSAKLRLEARESLTIYEGIQRAIAEVPHLAGAIGFTEFVAPEDEAQALGSCVSAARDLVKRGTVLGELGEFEAEIATYDKVIERFGRSDVPGLLEQIAKALVFKGLTQSQIGEHEAATDTYGRMIDLFEGSDATELQKQLVTALVSKGMALDQIGRHETAIRTYDEVIELFGSSNASELQYEIAVALVSKGIAQYGTGESEAAIATYDGVVQRFGGSDPPELQEQVAKALVFKGYTQERNCEHRMAIATYNDVIKLFGDSHAPELQEQLAMALINKGRNEGQLGQPEAEIATYEEVVERFGRSDVTALQEHVAIALINKGRKEGQLGQPEAEIATYEEVVERFGRSRAPELQKQAGKALVFKGITLDEIGEHETAITTYDEVIKSFESSDAPELQEKVATALVFKGMAQGEVGEHETAIATYDKVIELFGGSDASDLQQGIAMALVCKGVTQGWVGEDETAITTYNEVIERFGRSDVPALQAHAGAALLFKSEKQIEIGRAAEALDASGDLENRFGALPFEPDITLDWEAKRTRTEALLALNSCPAAIDVFCKIYASLIPGNRTMMRDVGVLAIDMIAAGASVPHLIEILSSDKAKADTLKPLVVALRELAGDSVHAPAEILDVAADIRKAIAARRAALESR